MGTKAVFAIKSGEKEHYKAILGMVHDGTVKNLKYIAGLFKGIAHTLHVVRKLKNREFTTVANILTFIEQHTDGWAFQDNISNVEWVSHSVILDTNDWTLRVYEGQLEDFVETVPVLANMKEAKEAVKKFVAKEKSA